MAPEGWQNISSNRQRRNTRDAVLAEIKEHYPEAANYEPLKDDFLACYMDDQRIVAVAWREARGDWSFVMLSKFAYKLGSGASLVKLDRNRFRVVPFKAQDNPAIKRQIAQAEPRRRKLLTQDRYIYPQDGHWFVDIIVGQQEHKFGPYHTYDEAHAEMQNMVEEVRELEG